MLTAEVILKKGGKRIHLYFTLRIISGPFTAKMTNESRRPK